MAYSGEKIFTMGFNNNIALCQSEITKCILHGPIELLSNIISDAVDSTPEEALLDINQAVANPLILSILIRRILNDGMLSSELLNNSYYHENGFHKIVLLSGRNFKLRLHHFGVSYKAPMENIHDHRWPFASSVLYGHLNMELFKLTKTSEKAEELYHFIYDSDKKSGSYSTELKGKSFLRKENTRTFNAGESYLMLPDELHRIKNNHGEESITLIITGNPVDANCNLYAKRSILEREKLTVKYEHKTLVKILDGIIEKIAPQKN